MVRMWKITERKKKTKNQRASLYGFKKTCVKTSPLGGVYLCGSTTYGGFFSNKYNCSQNVIVTFGITRGEMKLFAGFFR